MRKSLSLLTAVLMFTSTQVQARNIVLTNDDGLTSNVVALYHALKEAGHDVIVSVPCTNQSGMGAALSIGRPLAPLEQSCLNDAAQAGDPGAGPMTRDDLPADDFYYVNSTPVMSLLYGLDVLGMERWGGEPDLVLSGPNEGQNVGAIILSSGTVSNAQFAAVRGLPAIALSAGANSEGADLANPVSVQVAQRAVELVTALDNKAGDGALLPRGLALNVNFPDDLAGAQWRQTQIGTYNAYAIGFSDNMAETASPTMRAMAEARGIQVPPLPGLNFEMNETSPTADQQNDESVVYRQHIAVSPMQAGYAASPAGAATVDWQLSKLLSDSAD
ncbi:5'/3'-nucleotidase SurE [Altericroceibacterium endophyticum]|uniref:5'-nucleotidase n=1 Tax=Altericroceibacterium endophyticum TaxID=1808508 RepID=A0A6I4T7Y3_9SPHN|nr:5'/3'-nucleotidase SurE [Altericroceibacterium endophyticum]MXO65905.1 acid phosphatase [Altericroceibacterium endophyticum]